MTATDHLWTFSESANLPDMIDIWLPKLEKKLIGRRCEIVRREADWAVNFLGGGGISLPIPWRIVSKGRIAFADQDDAQKFGLPAPLNGEIEANRLIRGQSITMVLVTPDTADLSIYFGNDLRLDAFNNSCGYEGWHISLPPENGSMSLVAMGGGDVAVF